MGSTVPLWIDNTEVPTSIQFPVTLSTTGKVVHHAYGATPEVAIMAVDSAQKAFASWSKTTPWERRKLLVAAGSLLQARRDEIAAILQVSQSFISNHL
jgi:acyl-CoA reductase-like NAD-dependent aldehyde dehydrogenase